MTTASDDHPSATVCDENCVQWWCTCPCEAICCLCDDIEQSCAILCQRVRSANRATSPPEQIVMTGVPAVFVESAVEKK